jgi:hypothetical protein
MIKLLYIRDLDLTTLYLMNKIKREFLIQYMNINLLNYYGLKMKIIKLIILMIDYNQ